MTEDPEILAEAERLHARCHPSGYRGKCFGPTVEDFRRAERVVKLRRAEAPALTAAAIIKGEHLKLDRKHQHICVVRRCGKRFACQQRCDPHALDDSLCPDCYSIASSGGMP